MEVGSREIEVIRTFFNESRVHGSSELRKLVIQIIIIIDKSNFFEKIIFELSSFTARLRNLVVNSRTLWRSIVDSHNLRIVELFHNYKDVLDFNHIKHKTEFSFIMYAILKGIDQKRLYDNRKFYEVLIKIEPDLNRRCKLYGHCFRENALCYAVKYSCLEFIEMLLQNGADPNATNTFQEAPIHIACKERTCDKLKLLVKYKAQLDVLDTYGQSIIHIAIHHSFAPHEILQFILPKVFMYVNLKSNKGFTPTLLGTSFNKSAGFAMHPCLAIKTMVIYGADVNIRRDKVTFELVYRCPMYQNREEFCPVLEDSIRKLELIGYEMLPELMKKRRAIGWYRNYTIMDNEYFGELAKLKMKRLNKTTQISFFDAFFQKRKKLVQICRKDNFSELNGYESLEKDFPHYGNLLKSVLGKAIWRSELMVESAANVSDYIGTALPPLVTDEIFSYFTNFELKNLSVKFSLKE